jgi:hypothetical protein
MAAWAKYTEGTSLGKRLRSPRWAFKDVTAVARLVTWFLYEP